MKCSWKLTAMTLQLLCKSKIIIKKKKELHFIRNLLKRKLKMLSFSNIRNMEMTVLEQDPGICISIGTRIDPGGGILRDHSWRNCELKEY